MAAGGSARLELREGEERMGARIKIWTARTLWKAGKGVKRPWTAGAWR
jgi:hypothetical protein